MSLAQRMHFLHDMFEMTAIIILLMSCIYFETRFIYKKSPGDLSRLAITQTPVENH